MFKNRYYRYQMDAIIYERPLSGYLYIDKVTEINNSSCKVNGLFFVISSFDQPDEVCLVRLTDTYICTDNIMKEITKDKFISEVNTYIKSHFTQYDMDLPDDLFDSDTPISKIYLYDVKKILSELPEYNEINESNIYTKLCDRIDKIDAKLDQLIQFSH